MKSHYYAIKGETMSIPPPERILVMRMHAIGDVAIVLPYVASLATLLPDAQIDFLTTGASQSLVSALKVFNRVYCFPHSANRRERAYHALRWSDIVRSLDYDLILDLQGNWVTATIRRLSLARRSTGFDRFSPQPAGTRVEESFRSAGFSSLVPRFDLPLREDVQEKGNALLRSKGWRSGESLVLFNPAGLWPTRNWSLDNYETLGRVFLEDPSCKILFMGTDRVAGKVGILRERLGSRIIDLVGQTTLGEALAILPHVSIAVSEDSGLMHMAWVSGVPTVALFGSTRADWSTPLGTHTRCLHSGDLDCGFCMAPTCRHGDVRCLTRHTPAMVYEIARSLMSSRSHPA